eukprot:10614219-Alexandrium_andersonii.AAC.1
MARVRLVQGPVWRPPDDAVQQLHLLQVLRASTAAPLYFTHTLLAQQLLHDVQVGVVPGEGAVVA